jgi:hypothetical protein
MLILSSEGFGFMVQRMLILIEVNDFDLRFCVQSSNIVYHNY